MRQTVIALMSQVDVFANSDNMSQRIFIVAENFFDYKFKQLPCEKSCLNIMDEAGVISNYQTAKETLTS